jgi:hypothetical protein
MAILTKMVKKINTNTKFENRNIVEGKMKNKKLVFKFDT